MDMSSSEIDKRRPSALDVLARFKPEDPVEKVKRLEKEIAELRAFRLRAKGVLAETWRLLNSLEAEFEDREAKKYARRTGMLTGEQSGTNARRRRNFSEGKGYSGPPREKAVAGLVGASLGCLKGIRCSAPRCSRAATATRCSVMLGEGR